MAIHGSQLWFMDHPTVRGWFPLMALVGMGINTEKPKHQNEPNYFGIFNFGILVSVYLFIFFWFGFWYVILYYSVFESTHIYYIMFIILLKFY